MLTQVNPREASPVGSFLANCRAYFGLAICICSSQLHLPRSKLKRYLSVMSIKFNVSHAKKSTDPTALSLQNQYLSVRLQGLEPWTNRLRVYCSTN